MYGEAGIKDYYTILGIAKNATQEEIKSAFRDKAKKYHPDVSDLPNAHQLFVEIGEAYEVLKDPRTRESYDNVINERATFSNDKGETYSSTYNKEYREAQQRAKKEAESYASISLDELISNVIGYALDAGRTVLIGGKDKPNIGPLDCIKMGFLGFVLTICLIISFTGIGTVPGLFFGLLIVNSLTKNGRFIGIVPFILCTLVTDLLVIIFIISAIP